MKIEGTIMTVILLSLPLLLFIQNFLLLTNDCLEFGLRGREKGRERGREKGRERGREREEKEGERK